MHTFAADLLPATPAMQAFDARQSLAKTDPLLAFALWVEAAADRRIENDVNSLALLADITERARAAVARHEGRPFQNRLYR